MYTRCRWDMHNWQRDVHKTVIKQCWVYVKRQLKHKTIDLLLWRLFFKQFYFLVLFEREREIERGRGLVCNTPVRTNIRPFSLKFRLTLRDIDLRGLILGFCCSPCWSFWSSSDESGSCDWLFLSECSRPYQMRQVGWCWTFWQSPYTEFILDNNFWREIFKWH